MHRRGGGRCHVDGLRRRIRRRRGDSTTLVAYFSATGSTKRVAEDIATTTGGTLFAIEPAEAYTSDDLNYNDADSRVSREHDDERLRDVKLKTTEVPD